jgi:hypothetical protein
MLLGYGGYTRDSSLFGLVCAGCLVSGLCLDLNMRDEGCMGGLIRDWMGALCLEDKLAGTSVGRRVVQSATSYLLRYSSCLYYLHHSSQLPRLISLISNIERAKQGLAKW